MGEAMQNPKRGTRVVRRLEPGAGEAHYVISDVDDPEVVTWGIGLPDEHPDAGACGGFSFLGSAQQFYKEFSPCK
jgi:hypothetical protein